MYWKLKGNRAVPIIIIYEKFCNFCSVFKCLRLGSHGGLSTPITPPILCIGNSAGRGIQKMVISSLDAELASKMYMTAASEIFRPDAPVCEHTLSYSHYDGVLLFSLSLLNLHSGLHPVEMSCNSVEKPKKKKTQNPPASLTIVKNDNPQHSKA